MPAAYTIQVFAQILEDDGLEVLDSFELGGHPVLLWCIAAAEASAAYAAIVVVAPADGVAMLARIAGTRARVVAGGATRTASSWAGLDALAGHDVIAIHDGARPFASPSLFAAVAAVAAEYGSAVPGLAIAETVRRADQAGHAIEEVDRGGLWTAQTPQAFRRTLLERARASAGDRSFTDDAAAVIAMNEDVRLVPGERRNFKEGRRILPVLLHDLAGDHDELDRHP